MAIINIRGCNGAGKTTLVRALLNDDPGNKKITIVTGWTQENGSEGTLAHYLPASDTIIVGPYEEGKATGGMDNINRTAEALAAVEMAATHAKNVVFEGVLISTVFNTWLEFSRKMAANGQQALTWAFMDTDADTCVARVKQRRAAKGRPEEGFKENLVRNKHRGIARVMEKASAAGEFVCLLDGTVEQLKEFLD